MCSLCTTCFSLLHFIVVVFLAPTAVSIYPSTEDFLNVCQEGESHKGKPGPEPTLFGQCQQWKNRSCCTATTSRNIHYFATKAHNSNIDFELCERVKPLSAECAKSFIQDSCFYECSPNLGPWILKAGRLSSKDPSSTTTTTSHANIPLCSSDCHTWFNSCKNDLVCADNWRDTGSPSLLKKTQSNNGCSKCKTFKQVYLNAPNFCETVSGNWWKYTLDQNETCLRLWFNSSKDYRPAGSHNPNDEAARAEVQEIQRDWSRLFLVDLSVAPSGADEFLSAAGSRDTVLFLLLALPLIKYYFFAIH